MVPLNETVFLLRHFPSVVTSQRPPRCFQRTFSATCWQRKDLQQKFNYIIDRNVYTREIDYLAVISPLSHPKPLDLERQDHQPNRPPAFATLPRTHIFAALRQSPKYFRLPAAPLGSLFQRVLTTAAVHKFFKHV